MKLAAWIDARVVGLGRWVLDLFAHMLRFLRFPLRLPLGAQPIMVARCKRLLKGGYAGMILIFLFRVWRVLSPTVSPPDSLRPRSD